MTLQATNLTSEHLTLTVLAPTQLTSPPFVLNTPTSNAINPFSGYFGRQETISGKDRGGSSLSFDSINEQSGDGAAEPIHELKSPVSAVASSNRFDCTHLWLQSRIPVG